MHAVHPPGEQRDERDRDELRSGLTLRQETDREWGQHREQQVAEAPRITDQRAGGARDDPGEHDQGERTLVQRKSRDGGGGAEPPGEPDAGDGEAHAAQGLLRRRRQAANPQPPPGS